MESKKTSKKVFNIISNIIFAIVMVLLVIFMVYGFGSISQNKVPSFFGQSYMWIQSGSMTDTVYSDPYDEESEVISDGFQIGDVVIISQVDTMDIKVGDIIAFYNDRPKDDTVTLTPIEEVATEDIRDISSSASRYSGNRTFHQVMDIEVDEDGYIWFTTKGSHNGSVDSNKVRADYVIGKYTPSALAGILQFISSGVGIIILVVIPSCIVLFLLLLSIIDTIDKMIKKKKEEEAFQDALIQSVNANNSTSTAKKETRVSSYGGLTESSMAGFEREIAKIEKEKANDSQDNKESKNENNIKETKTETEKKVPPKKPTIKKTENIETKVESGQSSDGLNSAEKVESAETKTEEKTKPASKTKAKSIEEKDTKAKTTPPKKPTIKKTDK